MESPLIQKVCPLPAELSEIKKNLLCPEEGCNRMFLNSANLDMHLLKHHKRSNKCIKINADIQYQYHCPVDKCFYNVKSERFFKNMKYLKQHFLKVHAEKCFCCEQCHKGYSTEAALKKHERLCGVKFICSCNYAYDSYEALLTHAKRHQHSFDEKYKLFGKDTSSVLVTDDSNKKKATSTVKEGKSTSVCAISVPVHLLAAVALNEFSNNNFGNLSDKGVQTESKGDSKRQRKSSNSFRAVERTIKRRTSTHTQTGQTSRAKHPKISTQTQTMGDYILKKAMHAADILVLPNEDFTLGKQNGMEFTRKRRKSMETQTIANFTSSTSVFHSSKESSAANYTSNLDSSINLNHLNNMASTSFSHLNNNSNLYQLDVDILPDLWLNQKNSSGTQTSPVALNSLINNEDMLSHTVTQTDVNLTLFDADACVSNNPMQSNPQQMEPFSTYFDDTTDNNFNTSPIVTSFGRGLASTPMDQLASLAVESYTNSHLENLLDNERKDEFDASKLCSIETQTEIDVASFLPDCDNDTSFTLCSNIETQTTEEFSSLDHLIYSNMCTQTCDEILFSELGFADIETQTAWPQYSDSSALVSIETQTSLSGGSTVQINDRPWLMGNKNAMIGTSHMETQTNVNDFQNIIAELVKEGSSDIL